MNTRTKPGYTRPEHFIASRGLTWQEVEEVMEWFKAHKKLSHGKFVENRVRGLRKLKGQYPAAGNIRITVNSLISPELAMLFKLAWG